MKKLLPIILALFGLGLFAGESQAQRFWPRLFGSLRISTSANYRTRCIIWGGSVRAEADPTVALLLQRIADQQAQMLANQQTSQLLAAQNQNRQSDPQLLALITQLSSQLSSQQDRLIDAINSGKIENAQNVALMREMISGQQQLIAAINNRPQPSPSPPPVIVNPAPNPAPVVVPPVVVTPPAGGVAVVPGAGGALNTIPGAGGPIQALPGPGGSLNLIPPAGGSLQAVPGPGGSINVLPGGVKPPEGTRPPIGGATGPLPGSGGAIGAPPGGAIPGMPEATGPIVFKTLQKPYSPLRR